MAAVFVQLACFEGGGDGQATAFVKSLSALLEDSWAQWSHNQAEGSLQLGFWEPTAGLKGPTAGPNSTAAGLNGTTAGPNLIHS